MSTFKHVSVDQAQQLLQEDSCQIVDIRDQQSYALAHIQGAEHLHNENVADFVAGADKQAPLIVYCYHGNSSQGAAQYFAEQGFTEVYSMDGGFEQWRQHYPSVAD